MVSRICLFFCEMFWLRGSIIKMKRGLSCGWIVKNLACQGRRHRFDTWSWKIPKAKEQLRLCKSHAFECDLEPGNCNYWSPNRAQPLLCNKRSHCNRKPSYPELETAHVQQETQLSSSSVQLPVKCPTSAILWMHHARLSLSITSPQSLLKLMFIMSVMPSKPSHLCHPLPPALTFPSIRVFPMSQLFPSSGRVLSFSISLSTNIQGQFL